MHILFLILSHCLFLLKFFVNKIQSIFVQSKSAVYTALPTNLKCDIKKDNSNYNKKNKRLLCSTLI